MELPEDIRSALDEKVYAHVATLNPDGSPQVSVMWITTDGDKVLFSATQGRVKTRNMRGDARVAISFTLPDDPYKNIVMRGRVTKAATDGTWLIDRLASKYLGHDEYQFAGPDEVRVNFEVEIDSLAQSI